MYVTCDRGEPESYSDRVVRAILDFDHERSSGIFNPSRARQLETERFREIRRNISWFLVQHDLEDWRLDYWKKYGVDPRIDGLKS